MTPSQLQTVLYKASRPVNWIVSQAWNIKWWIMHITILLDRSDIGCIRIRMKSEKSCLRRSKDVDLISKLQSRFKWRSDGRIDWTPWLITAYAAEFRDDCDGAEVLGSARMKWAGYYAEKRHLCREWTRWSDMFRSDMRSGHAVAVGKKWNNKHIIGLGYSSGNEYVMVSNDSTVELPNGSDEAILDWSWHKRYNKVI